jgi:sec-independent protein translocase protein TatA
MFPGVGASELVVIFLVVLLLFGSKRLPELARGIGKSMRDFRKAADDVKKEIDIHDEL